MPSTGVHHSDRIYKAQGHFLVPILNLDLDSHLEARERLEGVGQALHPDFSLLNPTILQSKQSP